MKNAELHRIIQQAGWILIPGKGKGSHMIYEKDGNEIDNRFAKLILKEMGII